MWNLRKMESNCGRYEVELADAVERATERGQGLSLSAELASHVAGCERCRQGVESVDLSRALLRWGLEPAGGPRPGFAMSVLAAVRAEEDRLAMQRTIFWRPLEHLAGRVALGACAAVMVLSFYVYVYVAPQASGQSQDLTELVQQPDTQQPQTPDEVLMSLAERNNVR